MRRTSVLLLTVLSCAGAVPAATPAAAAAPVCAPGPVELAGGGPTEVLAGQEHVQGYVLRRRLGAGRSCVVPGVTVQLFAQDAGTTTSKLARTATTDADGRVQFRVRPPYNVRLSARSARTGAFPATTSDEVLVAVATRLSLGQVPAGPCAVQVSGRAFPARQGSLVDVFRRQSGGDTRRVGPRLVVGADGRYTGRVARPCGGTVDLFAQIEPTARNARGSSLHRVVVATRTTTCGRAATRSGEAGTALTHGFEPFNTTTAVGGYWWGERVVSNRTDRTLTFDSDSTRDYELQRRGTQVLVGGSGFSDAITVRSRELAPGQEFRERIRLLAANCFAPQPPGEPSFGSRPGPLFPAGTTIVGHSVLSTSKGVSVSDRRALTVS